MNSIDSLKNRILERVPLEHLVKEKIQLENRGGRLVGLCCFHNEKSPSFYLYAKSYYCFGCHEYGDAISWVQHFEGLGFIAALKWLGNRFGIPVPELEDSEKARVDRRRGQLLGRVHEMFRQQLAKNKPVLDYLKKRGFSEDFIEQQRLGFAPDERDWLVRQLRQGGYSDKELDQNSLGHFGRGTFDYFRNRVIVPVYDTYGSLIGFGGRTLSPDEKQKYKNSRFDKAKNLFGLHQAKTALVETRRAIVVEGYFDVLQMWQHGFLETVACQGSKLTKDQMDLLAARVQSVYLVFDGDQAGVKAALSCLEHVFNFPRVKFRIISLPDGSDPDDLARSLSRSDFEALLAAGSDPVEFAVTKTLQSRSSDREIPNILQSKIYPWLARVSDRIKRKLVIKQIAELTGISSRDIMPPAAKPNLVGSRPPPVGPENIRETSRTMSRLSFDILGNLYFCSPDIAEQLDISDIPPAIQVNLRPIADRMVSLLRSGHSPAEARPEEITTEEFFSLFELLAKKRDAFVPVSLASLNKLKTFCTQHKIARMIQELRAELQAARPVPDAERQELVQKISELSRQRARHKLELNKY